MNKQTYQHISEASPAQLAFLALNGSYGEKLVASMLLESIAKDSSCPPKSDNSFKHAFPKGRWTV